jgi:hypothetical protein
MQDNLLLSPLSLQATASTLELDESSQGSNSSSSAETTRVRRERGLARRTARLQVGLKD